MVAKTFLKLSGAASLKEAVVFFAKKKRGRKPVVQLLFRSLAQAKRLDWLFSRVVLKKKVKLIATFMACCHRWTQKV